MGLRLVVLIVANGATHGKAARQASNLPYRHLSAAALVVLGVAVVGCAPICEEFMFRGVILRSFMQRLSFWPAAVLSSLLFGAFHAYEVSTAAGAVTLTLATGTLGLVNCVLVRLTDNLVPGILTHAVTNGLSVLLLGLGVTGH